MAARRERKEMIQMKKILAVLLAVSMILLLASACAKKPADQNAAPDASGENATAEPVSGDSDKIQGVEDGVLTVAMECAYAPYNWSQTDDANGAVPIKDSNEYANGYDVMMAKKICEANGWQLEIVRLDWDSLIPAVQTGQVDAVIAGQSMTAERAKEVDFAGPYLYATIVCVTKADSDLANATGKADFAGKRCTSQASTVWYDDCLPQIPDADIQTAKESAPAMLMALETGDVDFVCCDMPTAQGAVAAYPDLAIVDFADSEDGFEVSDEEINIGISLQKGNKGLLNAINDVVTPMSADDFNAMMADAIKIQPIGE